MASGRPLSAWHADGAGTALTPDARVVIEPPRAALYAQCDARFGQMLAGGALEEAAALHARGLDPALPAMKALGLAELAAALAGEDLRTAADRARMQTRRFAKRQLTWFRNQCADWPRAGSPEEVARFLHAAFAGAR